LPLLRSCSIHFASRCWVWWNMLQLLGFTIYLLHASRLHMAKTSHAIDAAAHPASIVCPFNYYSYQLFIISRYILICTTAPYAAMAKIKYKFAAATNPAACSISLWLYRLHVLYRSRMSILYMILLRYYWVSATLAIMWQHHMQITIWFNHINMPECHQLVTFGSWHPPLIRIKWSHAFSVYHDKVIKDFHMCKYFLFILKTAFLHYFYLSVDRHDCQVVGCLLSLLLVCIDTWYTIEICRIDLIRSLCASPKEAINFFFIIASC